MDNNTKLGIDFYEVLKKMNAEEIDGCIHKLLKETSSVTSKNELHNILNIVTE